MDDVSDAVTISFALLDPCVCFCAKYLYCIRFGVGYRAALLGVVLLHGGNLASTAGLERSFEVHCNGVI